MNQLPVNPIDRNAVDRTVRRRRESARALICRWRRDPVTGRAVMLLDNPRRLARNPPRRSPCDAPAEGVLE